MALPVWPAAVPLVPITETWAEEPAVPNLQTEMAGGNTKSRLQPGWQSRIISGTVRMNAAQFAVYRAFYDTTLHGGNLRFTAPIWNGLRCVQRTAQFLNGSDRIVSRAVGIVGVAMKLKIF